MLTAFICKELGQVLGVESQLQTTPQRAVMTAVSYTHTEVSHL